MLLVLYQWCNLFRWTLTHAHTHTGAHRFGFLMTFLRRYSYGAVALNMFVSAVVMVEAILWVGAAQQVSWQAVQLTPIFIT